MDFSLSPNCRSCSSARAASSATRSSRWRATRGRPRTARPRNSAANWWRWRARRACSRRMSAPEFGGLGLNHVGKAVVFEEAGYSLLGPVAMHIFAPDEGNMHLLEVVATPEQKERWLRPLARGDIRSCFCMTEPAPGAGSDPSALNTTAVQDGNHWVINGDEMVHHRRRRRRLRHHHGEGRGRRTRRCSSPTWTSRASRSCAPWTAWTRRSPAATRWCGSTICACRPATSWASRARGSATPRCGWRRRG